MVEWDKAAHRFIAPVSCVSFYPFKLYCIFVLVSALWQSVMDVLLCILLERACSADRFQDSCPTTEIRFSDKRPCRTRIRKRTFVRKLVTIIFKIMLETMVYNA